jgi:hypothetical protein
MRLDFSDYEESPVLALGTDVELVGIIMADVRS